MRNLKGLKETKGPSAINRRKGLLQEEFLRRFREKNGIPRS
jgi:hypothetical protein